MNKIMFEAKAVSSLRYGFLETCQMFKCLEKKKTRFPGRQKIIKKPLE